MHLLPDPIAPSIRVPVEEHELRLLNEDALKAFHHYCNSEAAASAADGSRALVAQLHRQREKEEKAEEDRRALIWEDLKKQRLIKALEQTKGNQSEAAEILGISRVTVWNQMKKFGINLKRGIDA